MSKEDLTLKISDWRRDFHKYPETGFLEMRTASIVASTLDKLGFDLQLGKDAMAEEHCMGKPSELETNEHLTWAKNHGAAEKYLQHFEEGFTGIVATYDTGNKGPIIAFRFDMDALDINEADDENHVPVKEGFQSEIPNKMHACGHDAHTAVGLGLATKIAVNNHQMKGTIKLIFQPAEEGARGAKSMVKANVVNDVDYFIASHLGLGVPHNHFVAANNGFLATSKLDITFNGFASHAGGKPEEGHNSLLAASTAALNIYAISRHSDGASRINVGEMHAGTGRNIIPHQAKLKVETRGQTAAINEYLRNQVQAIIQGAAMMYQNDYKVEVVGEARSSSCSQALAEILNLCAKEHPVIEKSDLKSSVIAGSEDATFFMEEVQENGGLATYCIFGTELAAGHHNEKFDIDEETLLPAVEILYHTIWKLQENGRKL